MKKSDYVEELVKLTRTHANKLTVKQLRELIAKHKWGTFYED